MSKKKEIIKNDTSVNWAKATFVPNKGEIILYTDLLKLKIGDGITSINDLPFSDTDYSPFKGNYIIKGE